ncbi:MAG: hypothetical protein GWN01_11160 [Nitrosopumilaceae archaeon]|nr:hypothetical protein [Nitrosopumilaceae archaeon]NIU87871.1 hypothetical protein [Nitrosopumilaceae archaeon]NIV66098.1 hypothetical protein [Nitrosopumilaceae archaeon]NIX62044.1 hypothetical protein [Nitrosopumilaceae archaeon]
MKIEMMIILSVFDFLEDIKTVWSEVPMQESAALRKAAEYFKETIKERGNDFEKFKLFSRYKLIVTLHQNLGNYQLALKYADDLLSYLSAKAKKLSELKLEKDSLVAEKIINQSRELESTKFR